MASTVFDAMHREFCIIIQLNTIYYLKLESHVDRLTACLLDRRCHRKRVNMCQECRIV